MKKLHERAQRIPLSDTNQPKKADQARGKLEEAQGMLDAETSSMGSMMRMMMGSQTKMMGGQTKMMAMGMGANPGGQPGIAGMAPGQAKTKAAARAAPAGGVAQPTNAPAAEGQPELPQPGVGMMGGGGMMMGGRMTPMSPEALMRRLRYDNAAMAARLEARDTNPRNKPIWKKLEEPVAMSFANATPLQDVINHIKEATTDRTYAGLPVYVDPAGLKEAGATLTSTVSIELEGVPLKTTLRLLLKQIGLAHCVRDGVLIISSFKGIADELQMEESARGESESGDGAK